jgi:hypothetical protein
VARALIISLNRHERTCVLRTGDGLQPKRSTGHWRREGLKVNVALVQRRVCSTECEYPSEFFLRSRLDVVEACDEEGEFGICELVVGDECLPEGYGSSVGNALECETHDAGELAIDQS